MRFTSALSLALVLLPTLQGVSASPSQRPSGKTGQKGGKVKSSVSSKPVALPSSTTPPASAHTGKVAATNNNGGQNGGGNNQDPQTSQCLDSGVIAPGLSQNGQNPPVAGQIDSLTTTNNFINFCLLSNLPNTNGSQVQGGSCNSVPMGQIPSVDNMVSTKFVFPKNGQTVPANQQFTVQLAINGMVTGNFVNAQTNYFGAPQQLQNGVTVGHSHVVIEALSSSDQTTPTNPKNFAFFKGLNSAAQNGILSTSVTNGLPAGPYRMCSLSTSSNHVPVIGPVAQHGSFDDCSYFQAVDGAAGGNNGGSNNGSPSSSASPAANSSPANSGGNNGGSNNGSPSSSTSPSPSPSPSDGGGNNGGANNASPSSTASASPASSSPANRGGNKGGKGGKKRGGGN